MGDDFTVDIGHGSRVGIGSRVAWVSGALKIRKGRVVKISAADEGRFYGGTKGKTIVTLTVQPDYDPRRYYWQSTGVVTLPVGGTVRSIEELAEETVKGEQT